MRRAEPRPFDGARRDEKTGLAQSSLPSGAAWQANLSQKQRVLSRALQTELHFWLAPASAQRSTRTAVPFPPLLFSAGGAWLNWRVRSDNVHPGLDARQVAAWPSALEPLGKTVDVQQTRHEPERGLFEWTARVRSKARGGA